MRLGALARSVILALLAAATLLLSTAPALAQEPTAPNSTDTATDEPAEDSDALSTLSGLAACATGAGGLLGVVQGMVNSSDDASLPTCADGMSGVVDGGVGVVADAATGAAQGAVEKAALAFGDGGVALLKYGLGWWITFNPVDEAVFLETVAAISDYTFYIQIAAFSLSMILLGARLALARSGSIRDTSEEGFRQMARATLVAGAFTSLVLIATRLSDNLANWFMNGTVGSDPSQLVEAMVSINMYGGTAGTALLFVIGIIGILGGLVMAFLMLLRTGFLVLMAAALPIAGAAGGTKIGSQAFDKMIAWTIAWLLVKPVGAFVIGCSAMLFLKATPTITDPDNGDALMALSGVILLCSAALVLPALMRMIVPNVGALGGGGSGVAAAAGVAAGAAKVAGMVATGGTGAGTGAAAATSTNTSGTFSPPTGSPPPAPATFGNAPGHGGSGQQPGGNGQGSPGAPGASGGEGPAGSDSGTPSGTDGAPSSGGPGQGEPVATGAAPHFNDGGFER